MFSLSRDMAPPERASSKARTDHMTVGREASTAGCGKNLNTAYKEANNGKKEIVWDSSQLPVTSNPSLTNSILLTLVNFLPSAGRCLDCLVIGTNLIF